MKLVLVCAVVIVAVFVVTRLVGRLPANCDEIAEQLASYELGNYAEPEDRAPVVDKHRALCKREAVRHDEAACLDKARSKLAAARYVPALNRLTEQMCACRAGDRPCADKVSAAMVQWAQEWAKLESESGNSRPEPMSETDIQAMQNTMMRYSECMTKAFTPAH